MLDLVERETKRIDSRFLEPACGSGNFLVEVLNRKLDIIKTKYIKNQSEYEKYSIMAISSIYGIDILQDNVDECKQRLFDIFDIEYSNIYKNSYKDDARNSVRFILNKNIICGDALTLAKIDSDEFIAFSEFSFVNDNMIKRRDYELSNLLAQQPQKEDNLFSDMHEEIFLPTPIKEYPLIHFLKLKEQDD